MAMHGDLVRLVRGWDFGVSSSDARDATEVSATGGSSLAKTVKPYASFFNAYEVGCLRDAVGLIV